MFPSLTSLYLLIDRDLFEVLRCRAAEIKASIRDPIKGKRKRAIGGTSPLGVSSPKKVKSHAQRGQRGIHSAIPPAEGLLSAEKEPTSEVLVPTTQEDTPQGAGAE